MEKVFMEISNMLKDGPCEGKENIFLEVFEVILSCTDQKDASQFFTKEFLNILVMCAGHNSLFKGAIYKIFINLFSDKELSERLCGEKDTIAGIVTLAVKDILEKNSQNADLASNLLSNLTRNQDGCKLMIDNMESFEEMFHKLVTAFINIGYNSSNSLDQLAMVLCNLSQLTEVRNILTQKSQCVLHKLVPFMNHDNVIRRKGIVGVVHNCSFDSSVHSLMLGCEVDVLPYILLPLAGPEQFDEEDNDKLPIDLQYLPDSKLRESDPEIRKTLLETLNQFCATKFGRQFLRDHNTYIILRELHKWEQNQVVLVACENVVDILIKTEDEIGFDQLKDVSIPKDLEEKFNKELLN